MTHQATDMLSFQRLLKNPKPLLLADRDAPFKEQSTFTLLSALFAAGWKLLRAKPKDSMPLLNINVGPVSQPQRLIRLSPDASHVARSYLVCLAMIWSSSDFRTFLRENEILSVKHGQDEKYYDRLLSQNPEKLLKVDFEVDGGVRDPQSLRDSRVTAGGRGGGKKMRLPESFRWGAVSFKYHQPPKGSQHGSLQCDCMRRSHRRTNQKGQPIICTWTCKFENEDAREELVRRMKHWVVLGLDCATHRKHQDLRKVIMNKSMDEIPDETALNAMMPSEDRDATDIEDESMVPGPSVPGEASSSSALPAPTAKAKGKAKQTPKAKAKAKATRRQPAEAAEPAPKRARQALEAPQSPRDEAGSDPPTSSDSGSRSSSSERSKSSGTDESGSSSSSSSSS